MSLTKAERFKLLNGGDVVPPTGGASRASTNIESGSQSPTATPPPSLSEQGSEAATERTRGSLSGENSLIPPTKLGQLASIESSFCPVQAVTKYPYKYIHDRLLQDAVASSFFAGGRFFERHWSIFYIHPPFDVSRKPLLLLPLTQVLSFFDTINKGSTALLRIPSQSDDCGFQVSFAGMEVSFRPRHLGESTCRGDFQNLEQMVPAATFRPDGETPELSPPSERSLEAFKRKMELVHEATKKKSRAARAKKQQDRIEKQREWGRQIKRTQRYLGLRQRQEQGGLEQASRHELGMTDHFIDLESPAPYPMESSVVFVSVDIESFERDHRKITEIGISVLDTKDLDGVPPGKGGIEWMKHIRAKHLRIREHAHLRNKDFVVGCADRFEFGESRFVGMREAPSIIAESFRFPSADQTTRNIILLGHGIDGDIEYLKGMGYNPLNLNNLIEVLDTSAMYRYLKREPNPRSLGSVLSDLDIMGWNLHNAGNDAVYTLQAMLAIVIKAATERDGGTDWAEERRKRVGEAAKEAVERALEDGEGWSSAGEGDGGVADKPWLKPPRPSRRQRSAVRNSQKGQQKDADFKQQ
ncbi:hypothetical protein GP486_005627 [Trichoglossum hirsutum]|uniref:Gfd2/YDR514C-like C-terminal domain-containing protein n=1 Tax=Trichoglossum hirsutum TaxID=265104 RepID=A0A9P8RMA6_9PEZI|nr:hypothetical protein GP486_005627 [Trichoglossum hirsutum]